MAQLPLETPAGTDRGSSVRSYKVTSSGKTATGGIDFNFGNEPANSFTQDQLPDLRADLVMAPPSAAAHSLPRSHSADRPNGRIRLPFNIKEWWDEKQKGEKFQACFQ